MSLSNTCVQIGDLLADVADCCIVVAGGFSKFHHGYGDMCGELSNAGVHVVNSSKVEVRFWRRSLSSRSSPLIAKTSSWVWPFMHCKSAIRVVRGAAGGW
jgi:hypothetical protein